MKLGRHVAKKIFGADQKHSMSSQLGHGEELGVVGEGKNDEFPVPMCTMWRGLSTIIVTLFLPI